jgi:hypothetical protein
LQRLGRSHFTQTTHLLAPNKLIVTVTLRD